MAEPDPSSPPQSNTQPPPPSQPTPQPPPRPAKKSYSSIVQHPTASHFQHDPDRAAKKSFHNEDLLQMGTVTSTKNGTSGATKRDQEPAHTSNNFKQLSFTPAWSLEEGESDIMETHMEGSRTLYKGDTTTHRNTDSQETEAASEEEEESTPIFNRFQSLRNLGEEEPQITDQLYQPHTKDITEAQEARAIVQNISNNNLSATQQEEDKSYEISQTATHTEIQDQLLLDFASSHKHKRNKSQEDLHIQPSPKTSSKGKRTKAVLRASGHKNLGSSELAIILAPYPIMFGFLFRLHYSDPENWAWYIEQQYLALPET
ncbi:hypothetical protein Salat_1699500 [Sesamum alatum]|uniref:Uncharacterized protein n=1 Tax=Sesamum alatum TaxID=300844 RepID=A0AAE2CKA1_9LAMI|nr:hypothetical protein Salat_1699500 [Sesamum alatum]